MLLSLTKINYKIFLINFLFSFIPISFIAGNLILNINILLFIIFTIFFYGKDLFTLNFNVLYKIIVVFFTFTILTGVINNLYFKPENLPEEFTIIIKTILYLRFLLFYFAIRILINRDIINFKSFFIFSSICTCFVCLDLIYQYIFGKDIFGYMSLDPRRMSGPFGDNERIAGSYIQRFSLFMFFLIPFFLKNKNKTYLYLVLLISSILVIVGLIIAGNRMPLVLFIILIFSYFAFNKKMRKFSLLFFSFFLIIFIAFWNLNLNVKIHFGSFKTKIIEVIQFSSAVINNESSENKDNFSQFYEYSVIVNGKAIRMPNNHVKGFNSGYQTWLENKYFGGGIKSFRYNCVTFNCSTHPHNYYLEILSELGLIGFLLLSIIFLKVFYVSFLKRFLSKNGLNYDQTIIPFMFLFLIEIFPIKSTGSFFTTANATYIFLIMSVTIAFSQTSGRKN